MSDRIDPRDITLSVLPTPYIRSPKTLADECDALERISLYDAIQNRWDTDAHFACYHVDGEEQQPRLSKALLKTIRDVGGSVSLSIVALDFDLSDPATGSKRAWRSDDEAWDYTGGFFQQCPVVPSCVYATKHGLRAIFILSRPVAPEEWESIVAALLDAMDGTDFPCDRACKDWTRLYRLPRTARPYENGLAECRWAWLNTDHNGELREPILFPDSVLPVDEWVERGRCLMRKRSRAAVIPKAPVDAPEQEDAEALLRRIGDNGRTTGTDFFKLAKHQLKGRECYACIFDHAPLAIEGERDSTMTRYVGQAISLLHGKPGMTASHIYALFVDAVSQLEPDDQTPDWLAKLWDLVCRLWNTETEALAVVEQSEHDAQRALAESVWRNNPLVPGVEAADPDDAWRAIQKHAIAMYGRDYYVLQSDGFYQRHPSIKDHIAVDLRDGLGSVIPLKRQLKNGEWVDVSEQALLRAYGFKVVAVDGAPQVGGGVIRVDDSGKLRLTVPLFSRKASLTPCFDEDVDTWLELLGGDELRQWIAWSLAFDEGPICALMLWGAPASGKSMLVQALSECIDSECFASAEELGRFQSRLLSTPFLSVDEGMPKFGDGGRSVPDTLRMLTGGGPIPIERKGKDIISIPSAVRVIITSNSDQVIRDLIGNRDLSPDDREAIASRLRVIHVTRDPADWLKSKGGYALTSADGGKWVRPVGGDKPSDYVAARHFLYLYENRHRWPKGDRFVVAGQADQSMLRRLAIETPTGSAVIETLIRMVECQAFKKSRSEDLGVILNDDGLFVTCSAVGYFHNRALSGKSHGQARDISLKRISVVIKEIAESSASENPYRIHDPRTGAQSKKSRWYQVDPAVLLRAAQDFGHGCETLQQIVSRMQTGESLSDAV